MSICCNFSSSWGQTKFSIPFNTHWNNHGYTDTLLNKLVSVKIPKKGKIKKTMICYEMTAPKNWDASVWNHHFERQQYVSIKDKSLVYLILNIIGNIPNSLVFDEAGYYEAAAFRLLSEEKSSHSSASENFLSPRSKPELMLYYFVLKILSALMNYL